MTSDVIEFGQMTVILRVNSNGVIASASEAIQRATKQGWIASSLKLLAMTGY